MGHLQNKERIQEFKETGDLRYIYQKKLDKACFQLDMPYGDFKGLTRRTTSDETLCNKAFNIGKNPKYDGYQVFWWKRMWVVLLKMKSCKIKSKLKNYRNELLQNLTN